MASLFYPSSTARPTFNDDISKWNVASVSNMYQVCRLRCVHQTPRLLWRSVIGRHFCTALFGLGACSCPHSDSCLAAMPGPHAVLLLHRPATSMAWLGMGRLLPCFTLFWEDTHSTYSVVRNSTTEDQRRSNAAVAAVALHLDRRGPTHRSAPARPVVPACTALTVGLRLMRRGAQAFRSASAFNANIGAWNTASVTSMIYVCALCHCLCAACVA
jgi:surface protein